ncbi:hemolysin [Oscillatoriales cyanobacterium LEGE 11467]|uniref:Hemolysin n=1 Tax=Zarconia navalis LEGE 11467 TaxID=1828826 RepID=A0A928VV91_9CYAN|nr:choice-of-anchor Q domain-containing protein [Zarconia navalis]MBE9040872.1 hemolysin [Zarconia navalis LEGE 11467]
MATLTVTSTADLGSGSLREAIAAAVPGDTIAFDAGLANQTIALASTELEIDKNLIVDGANAAGLTLSGSNSSRIFRIASGVDFALRNVTVADGLSGDRGGAIFAQGQNTLAIENSRFLNNTGGQGGAIAVNSRSNLTITNSQFDGNRSTSTNGFSGGAISIFAFNTTTIQNSDFTNNQGVNGGAVYNLLSGLTVQNSRFVQNDATPGASTTNPNGFGGGIFVDGASDRNDPDSGTILVQNSLFDSNRSAGRGGGVFFFLYDPDVARIEGSTFVNNEVILDVAGESQGGGIWHTDGQLMVVNSTIANNRVSNRGGGLFAFETADVSLTNSTFSGNIADDGNGGGVGGALRLSSTTEITNTTIANNRAGSNAAAIFSRTNPVTLTNTIVANNTAGADTNTDRQTNITFEDGGNNLQFPGVTSSGTEERRITDSVAIADPNLSPLQDNGGGILTHALLPGSAAIDAGQNTVDLTADGRGALRTDGQIDIGAFEAGAIPPEGSTFTPNDDTVTLENIDDLASALAGNDLVFASGGSDTIFGNSGNDTLVGNSDSDFLSGDRNNDLIFGNQQNDLLVGDAGSDTIVGGRDNDILFGNTENDVLFGDLGNDSLFGGQNDDTLTGGDGDDRLSGDFGNDSLVGGNGSDRFVLAIGRGSDTIADFENGPDLLVMTEGLTFDRLTITQDGEATVVTVADRNEILVRLDGIGIDLIGAEDFAIE